MKKKTSVTILGGGTWGTAVASVLAHNNHQVLIWCREPEIALEINTHHTNSKFTSNIKLSPNISATHDIREAISKNKIIFESIPVTYLRVTLEPIINLISPEHTFVILSKGLEQESLLLPSDIINNLFKKQITTVILSGPSFAKELIEKQFTSVILAGDDLNKTHEIKQLLDNNYFKTELSQDTIGTQLGGALKNVCALASGIVQGNGCKANTTAYIITQGLKELALISKNLGGQESTIYGLAGLGDLLLSCTGTLSKNLQAGRLLAQDRSLESLKQQFACLPEGINTIQSLIKLIERENLDTPLCKNVYNYIFNNAPFEKFLS